MTETLLNWTSFISATAIDDKVTNVSLFEVAKLKSLLISFKSTSVRLSVITGWFCLDTLPSVNL